MVSLVIVSHSLKLAEGVRDLASQMVQEQVTIALAAGIDDPDQPLGTDAMKVYEAIVGALDEAGVVVLMDLGSALLSAEVALEMLLPDERERVRLCAAPLVEGALAAAVQASVGGSLEEVCREALGALDAKQRQMDLEPEMVDPETSASEEAAAADEIRLVIPNQQGLHARPAARFVSTANRFSAQITVRKSGGGGSSTANAKSINQVATLGARQGDEIVVQASGPDAAEALSALAALAAINFGDEGEMEATSPATGEAEATLVGEESLGGIAASPGVAIGPVVQFRPQLPDVARRSIDDPATEWRRLQQALRGARAEIEKLQRETEAQVGRAQADVFAAHALILQDPALVSATRTQIAEELINAEAAWQEQLEAIAAQYRALEDDYLRSREADVLDAGRRVLRQLMEVEAPSIELARPSILIATDLTPSDTARLDPEQVLGIGTEMGGPTSHSAILARAYGIPAVVGLGPAVQALAPGQIVALDGSTGRVWTDLTAELRAELEEARETWAAEREAQRKAGREPAVTRGGQRVEVAANIGHPRDVALALQHGAEGVGLFRTEFLFLDRESAPTEEEQREAYRAVARAMGDRPVIIRTLDVGGDKPLPYLDLGAESNPFLGWRGIRFCLDHPDIFLPQLRAILRAGAPWDTGDQPDLKLMLPMVSTLEEIRAAKELVREARADLRSKALPCAEKVEIGIMIEVPAAVAIADRLATEVDFFSIGTNDLTQYVMAADRGNARVAALADALHPSVLRLVQQTIVAADEAGIWVGMCGELAGNALAAPLLLGLGLDEFSMSAPAIPAVKAALRTVSVDEAKEIAAAALALDSADAVRRYLEQTTTR